MLGAAATPPRSGIGRQRRGSTDRFLKHTIDCEGSDDAVSAPRYDAVLRNLRKHQIRHLDLFIQIRLNSIREVFLPRTPVMGTQPTREEIPPISLERRLSRDEEAEIDTCYELLSSGRPVSQVLEEMRRMGKDGKVSNATLAIKLA